MAQEQCPGMIAETGMSSVYDEKLAATGRCDVVWQKLSVMYIYLQHTPLPVCVIISLPVGLSNWALLTRDVT